MNTYKKYSLLIDLQSYSSNFQWPLLQLPTYYRLSISLLSTLVRSLESSVVETLSASSSIIVGIGVNIGPKTFDEAISNVATSLANEGYQIQDLDLLRAFFIDFEDLYEDFKNRDYTRVLKILKDKSAVLGKEIYLIRDGQKDKVFAENIDEYDNLIVRNELGFLEEVFTGEISIRVLDSYI